MKVKVLAHKGHLVFVPNEPENGLDVKSWMPAGDGRIGPAMIATPEMLGISDEAIELMRSVPRNRDAVGDLMWSDGSFAWFGPNFRVMNPATAQAARDFRINENQYTKIPNELSQFQKKASEHAIRIRSSSWSWPYDLYKERDGGPLEYTRYNGFLTNYHAKTVYIASAYSHDDPAVVESRRKIAGEVCSKLIARGVHAISPVVYGTALMEFGPMKADNSWDSWQYFCNSILDNCEAVYVIKTEGWDQSVGIGAEMVRAATYGIMVYLIDPETLELEALPHKFPISKMSKEDAAEVSRLMGKKYSHHDVYRKGDHNEKDVRIMMYPSSHGMASLAITGSGDIIDPIMPVDLDNLLSYVSEKLERLLRESGDQKELEELEMRKKEIAADIPPKENVAAAKAIVQKYLLV